MTAGNAIRVSHNCGRVTIETPRGLMQGKFVGNEFQGYGSNKPLRFNVDTTTRIAAAIKAFIPAEFRETSESKYIGCLDDASPTYKNEFTLVPGTGETIVVNFTKEDLLL